MQTLGTNGWRPWLLGSTLGQQVLIGWLFSALEDKWRFMFRTVLRIMLTGLLLQFVVAANAQEQKLKAEVPFAFIAGETEMPAGQYEFTHKESQASVLQIKNAKGAVFNVPILTHLSPRADSTGIFFDKAEDNKVYLSEVYFSGIDGIHLKGAPGKHQHTKVAVK
jgi:hypothetical protein